MRKGGRLMDDSFILAAKAVDLLALSTALAGTSAVRSLVMHQRAGRKH